MSQDPYQDMADVVGITREQAKKALLYVTYNYRFEYKGAPVEIIDAKAEGNFDQ